MVAAGRPAKKAETKKIEEGQTVEVLGHNARLVDVKHRKNGWMNYIGKRQTLDESCLIGIKYKRRLRIGIENMQHITTTPSRPTQKLQKTSNSVCTKPRINFSTFISNKPKTGLSQYRQ